MRPRLARRGLGQTWLDAYAANVEAGAPIITPTLAQVQAQNQQDLIRAATDPLTGVVYTALLNTATAQSKLESNAAYQSGVQTSPPTWSFSDIFGLDPSTFDWSTVSNVLIISGLAVGGYFLYKAVK